MTSRKYTLGSALLFSSGISSYLWNVTPLSHRNRITGAKDIWLQITIVLVLFVRRTKSLTFSLLSFTVFLCASIIHTPRKRNFSTSLGPDRVRVMTSMTCSLLELISHILCILHFLENSLWQQVVLVFGSLSFWVQIPRDCVRAGRLPEWSWKRTTRVSLQKEKRPSAQVEQKEPHIRTCTISANANFVFLILYWFMQCLVTNTNFFFEAKNKFDLSESTNGHMFPKWGWSIPRDVPRQLKTCTGNF